MKPYRVKVRKDEAEYEKQREPIGNKENKQSNCVIFFSNNKGYY